MTFFRMPPIEDDAAYCSKKSQITVLFLRLRMEIGKYCNHLVSHYLLASYYFSVTGAQKNYFVVTSAAHIMLRDFLTQKCAQKNP
jgi:D-hexose-6-phosphate mutarotase